MVWWGARNPRGTILYLKNTQNTGSLFGCFFFFLFEVNHAVYSHECMHARMHAHLHRNSEMTLCFHCALKQFLISREKFCFEVPQRCSRARLPFSVILMSTAILFSLKWLNTGPAHLERRALHRGAYLDPGPASPRAQEVVLRTRPQGARVA